MLINTPSKRSRTVKKKERKKEKKTRDKKGEKQRDESEMKWKNEVKAVRGDRSPSNESNYGESVKANLSDQQREQTHQGRLNYHSEGS